MRDMSMLRRSRVGFVLLLGLLVTFAVPAAASAAPAEEGHGALYTTTNNPAGNQVLVFRTNKDGSLTQTQTVNTGGTGSAAQPPFSFPIVDSSGSMSLAHGGKVLVVVNDGDNTLSSFRVTPSGLELAAHVSSGGILPVSLTSRGDVLWAVNEESSNIVGFRISPHGDLSQFASAQLSHQFPDTVAAQIGFTPNGRQLIVSERGLNRGQPHNPNVSGVIDVFDVHGHDVGPAQPNTGVGLVDPNPFGFDFSNSGDLLMSNVGYVDAPGDGPPPIPQVFDPTQFVGSASSFDVSKSGTLTLNSNVLSGGRGACWLVTSKDGKYAFVTNTLSDTVPDIFSGIGAVTSYAVGKHGSLTYLGQVNTSPGGPTDEVVSQDGKYLYVLDPTTLGPDQSTIETYRIGKDGSLTHVATVGGLSHAISGIATGDGG
jgi:6-phosphogluconolactonase